MNEETCPECHYMRNELTPCKCGLYSKPTPPQMPEVIYAYNHGWHTSPQSQFNVSYTRTDLCEELKASLKDCSELLFTLRELIKRVPEFNHHSYDALGAKVNTALTKAQGLLR